MSVPGPPFRGYRAVAIALPTRLDGLSDADARQLAAIAPVFEQNRRAIERELGAPFRFVEAAPAEGARWIVWPERCELDGPRLDAERSAEPRLSLDRTALLLVSDASTAAGIWETFSLLRSLVRLERGALVVSDCRDLDEAVARIVDEVGDCYPAFGLRGLDWDAICARHVDRVRESSDPPAAMQEWLAELGDGHTWVRPVDPLGDLPYQAWVTPERAVLTAVSRDSAGWAAGARPGFRLLGRDAARWWARTASTPHARPLVAGRRLLAGPVGEVAHVEAEAPDGRRIEWSEMVPADSSDPVAEWRRLPSGSGYLKIRVWTKRSAIEEAVDAAFAEFASVRRLVVDLRGNPGGDITIATGFRDRFLRREGTVGTIRYSVSRGALSDPEPIVGAPASAEKRWSGHVRFLTDPLTYSSSEDAMLGLAGLDHVEVFGEPSGGGSGRMRALRLMPGWRLTVSTALTYDLAGRCVEGAGIPVDHPICVDRCDPEADDSVLAAADRDWD